MHLPFSMCDVINTDVIFGDPTADKGAEGGNVKVKCSYTWASDNKKFFCNETCEGKDILIETTQDRYQKGRYIIEDTRNGVFYVTITQLTKSDAGTYYCGVDRAIKATYGKVKIEVQDGEFHLRERNRDVSSALTDRWGVPAVEHVEMFSRPLAPQCSFLL
uniref:Immunoglobulin domain-containing protein n=1 Tax=Myripristis murdjan TaxID=586833 RepID=A0A667WT95_9TELE